MVFESHSWVRIFEENSQARSSEALEKYLLIKNIASHLSNLRNIKTRVISDVLLRSLIEDI